MNYSPGLVDSTAQRHPRLTTGVLALPIIAGGWLAVLFGAYDYVPWLTSPAVVGGVGVTILAGVVLRRQGSIRSRQIALAVVLGEIGFAVSL
jgi:hypothetical protein